VADAVNRLDIPGRTLPHEVDILVKELAIEPSDNLRVVNSQSVWVAAVKLMLRYYATMGDYVADMNAYVSDAVNRRAQLVCFPAYTGLLPAGVQTRGWEAFAACLRPQANTGAPDPARVTAALARLSDSLFDAYYNTMSALAGRHKVYIMAGSTLYFEENELRHRAFLFSHHGELVGTQDKLSLNSLELELQIESGSELKTFDTPLGPLSILIGEDNGYFELGRIAKSLGARILLNPTLYTGRYTSVESAMGVNMRAQESGVYAVQSPLVGDLGMGFSLGGPACVYAPYSLLRNKSGIVEQTDSLPMPELACARLNLDRLERLQNPYTDDVNPDLMPKYVDYL